MKVFKAIALASLPMLVPAGALAAEGQKDAKGINFSFEGAFGTFDRTQLQHGYKVYKEVCANCHGMKLISFRNLTEAGIFNEEQVKALAATFTVKDATVEAGERPALPSDRFPTPEYAAEGAKPPDLSLITKSRPGWYGTFNQLFNGIGGPQYVYSVLTGYEEPQGELAAEQPEGQYYNPYFGSGHWIGMPPPLSEGQVTYDDKEPDYKTSVDEMSRDVSAFLAWAADPNMETRKRTGFMVMIYLALLSALLYLVKKRVWSDVH
jgi:ubiquinol-cytochrome c reductase cytochrome c1 subunit